MSIAGANRGDFLQNPHRQTFDRVQSFEIVAQSIGGESGEPKSDLGSVLRELIHLGIPILMTARSRPVVIIAYAAEWLRYIFG
jgi:hypothetical protein